MYHRLLIAIMALCAPVLMTSVTAQELELPSFAGLKAKATQSVDIAIGSTMLGFASELIPNEDADSAELKKALGGLRSVQVRSYQFASDFAYAIGDIDGVRAQLAAPGWSQLVHTQDKNSHADVDIYASLDHQRMNGLAIVASTPREFTIVNIVGTIDLRQLARIQKHLGLPGPVVGGDLAHGL